MAGPPAGNAEQQASYLSAFIEGFKEVNDHVEYRIKVCHRSNVTWRVWRRFSDFVREHDNLVAECSGNEERRKRLPPRPVKSWLPVFSLQISSQLCEQRQQELEVYLEQLLADRDLHQAAPVLALLGLRSPEPPAGLRVVPRANGLELEVRPPRNQSSEDEVGEGAGSLTPGGAPVDGYTIDIVNADSGLKHSLKRDVRSGRNLQRAQIGRLQAGLHRFEVASFNVVGLSSIVFVTVDPEQAMLSLSPEAPVVEPRLEAMASPAVEPRGLRSVEPEPRQQAIQLAFERQILRMQRHRREAETRIHEPSVETSCPQPIIQQEWESHPQPHAHIQQDQQPPTQPSHQPPPQLNHQPDIQQHNQSRITGQNNNSNNSNNNLRQQHHIQQDRLRAVQQHQPPVHQHQQQDVQRRQHPPIPQNLQPTVHQHHQLPPRQHQPPVEAHQQPPNQQTQQQQQQHQQTQHPHAPRQHQQTPTDAPRQHQHHQPERPQQQQQQQQQQQLLAQQSATTRAERHVQPNTVLQSALTPFRNVFGGRPGSSRGASVLPEPPRPQAEPPSSEQVPEDEDEELLCVICMALPKTHAFIPCGHRCVCGGCASAIVGVRSGAACPVCRVDTQHVIKIFT
ncbi:unnamed protein product [Polarella glacialis]|uniref:RING-type E3 ubiquitin transferase n=1 Tax=Polarella glacialis TaxID=89957 RepID=A0A813G0X4_POLGL|nr:unnamed protein product [Polarella glacialis]